MHVDHSTAPASRRLRRSLAALSMLLLLATGCGSSLSDKELLAANSAGFAPGTAGTGTDATSSVASGDADAATASADASAAGTAGGTAGAAGGTAAAGKASVAGRGPAAAAAGCASSNKSPIRLGQIGVRSGPLGAAMQPGIDGTVAWVGSVNARGGLCGHPVELISVDDRGDPNQSLALARRLVEENKVVAIFDPLMPTTLQAITGYLQSKGVPIVGRCGCEARVTSESPIIFDVGATSFDGLTWQHLVALFQPGYEKQRAKVSVFYCREAATCTDLHQTVGAFEGKNGFHIVHEAQISIAQPDFTAEVIAARNAGAEAIITLADNATTIRIARSAKRQNFDALIVNQGGGTDERFFVDDVEGAIVGQVGVVDWQNSALMADYRQAMSQYAPNGVRGGMGANAWAAGKMLERIAPAIAANPTPAAIIEALYSLRGETLGGIIPPTSYRRGVANPNSNVCSIPARITGRKMVPFTGPEAFTCAPGWTPVKP